MCVVVVAIYYSTMKDFKTFLESSTIHGLVHISTNRRLLRLFWVFVVFIGFMISGTLIYQSFQAWNESPVTTTIQTLPIAEITLPKVTVCPPKNTFTNLNYDLKMTESMSLDNETRWELIFYAIKLIQDQQYEDFMSNLTAIEEENRYYNWYHYYTQLFPQYWGREYICTTLEGCGFNGDYSLMYIVNTNVTNGSFSTNRYGERFGSFEIKRIFKFILVIQIPKERQLLKNATLYFEIEKNMLKGYDKFMVDGRKADGGGLSLNLDLVASPYIITINPADVNYKYTFLYERTISQSELSDISMDQMPGFKIKWYFSEDLVPFHQFMANNYVFSRYVIIL